MLDRPFWIQRLEEAWQSVPIAWLAGVRRVGKTTLAESFGPERARYINCDLPVAEEWVRDPELFFRSLETPIVVFDEVHQLRDPARLLKIGADRFPKIKILATGSSTLAASRKFRDTLAGRKRVVHMVPVMWDEFSTFGTTLERRLFLGGLPQALAATTKQPAFYREWMDSFFARDIQRLFGFRDLNRFSAFLEYVMRQSGGQLEVTRTAAALGITRPTVESHLRALEITTALTLVRPFHGGGQNELTRQPKAYAFDTGFVSHVRGWDPLRPDDLGPLWEHVVLEHVQAHFPDLKVQYWRDKAGREIDFVLAHRRDEVDTIECKWDPASFDAAALRVFRGYYPRGRNYLVTPSGEPGRVKRYGALEVRICTPAGLRPSAKPSPASARTPA